MNNTTRRETEEEAQEETNIAEAVEDHEDTQEEPEEHRTNLIKPQLLPEWAAPLVVKACKTDAIAWPARKITEKDIGYRPASMTDSAFTYSARIASWIGEELMNLPGYADGVLIKTNSPGDYRPGYLDELARMVASFIGCYDGEKFEGITINDWPDEVYNHPSCRAVFFLGGMRTQDLWRELSACRWQYRVHKLVPVLGLYSGDLVLLTNVEEDTGNE